MAVHLHSPAYPRPLSHSQLLLLLVPTITIGRSGDTAYVLVAVLMISYVSVLWRGIFVYASQIVKRVAEQVNAERRVRRDELTSLPNRLAFFEELETAFSRLTRLQREVRRSLSRSQ